MSSLRKKISGLCCGLGVIVGMMVSSPVYAAFNAAQESALTQIGQYMDSFRTLKGQFVQVGPDGVVSEGSFYMDKPGKMRFEYRPPTPILILSDGYWVALEDTELKTQDRYPLNSTPLQVLLQDKFQTSGEHMKIEKVTVDDASIQITALDPTAKEQGKISILFSKSPFALKQWTVTDAQGLKTTLSVNDLAFDVPLKAKLFYIENDVKQEKTRFRR